MGRAVQSRATTARRTIARMMAQRRADSGKCALLIVLFVSASTVLGAQQTTSSSAHREHVCNGNHTSNAIPKSKSPRSTPGAESFYIFKRSVRLAFDKLDEKDAQFLRLYDIADIRNISMTAANYGGKFLQDLAAAKHYRRLYRLACILEDFLNDYMLVTVDTRENRLLDSASKQRASIFCEHIARLNSIKYELVQIIKNCNVSELKAHFKNNLLRDLHPYDNPPSETYKQRTDYTLHYIYTKLIKALQSKVKRKKVCPADKRRKDARRAKGTRKKVLNAAKMKKKMSRKQQELKVRRKQRPARRRKMKEEE